GGWGSGPEGGVVGFGGGGGGKVGDERPPLGGQNFGVALATPAGLFEPRFCRGILACANLHPHASGAIPYRRYPYARIIARRRGCDQPCGRRRRRRQGIRDRFCSVGRGGCYACSAR